jgi:hypothetical protein
MLKRTLCEEAAVYTLTGIDTRPKETVTEEIARGAISEF